jgi:4-diphosphocytidyl-2-C-methyl-D-erythritol kinase
MTRDVRVLARAKLTLSLRVLGPRPDGHHELEALVVSLRDPHDVVGLRIQAPFGVRVRLSGRAVIGVPADASNLAALGAALGSDVPFCVVGGAAWMRGRGEIVEPIPVPALSHRSGPPGGDGPSWPSASPPSGWPAGSSWPANPEPKGLCLVVAVPPFSLATPAVYRAWDELGAPSSTRAVPLPDVLAGPGLPDHLVNDLEPAAEHLEPRLRPFREALEAMAGAPALLAGSGSAYVVPVASPAQAAVVATQAGVELRAMAFATGLAARGVEAQKGPD